MTIDERVRDALHAYADPIEPAPGSWDRIEARLDDRLPRERRPRTPLVLAAVGILVILGLIAAAVVRDGENNVATDQVTPSPVVPSPGKPPQRVLVFGTTARGGPSMVVLPSASRGGIGEMQGVSNVVAGSPVAVTPDGHVAYVVRKSVNSTCGGGDAIFRQPIAAGVRDGEEITNATAPSVSPDGRYLAYLRCTGGTDVATIVLRNLGTGSERETPGLFSFTTRLLAFSPDSRHVLVEGRADSSGPVQARELDLVGGEKEPGRAIPAGAGVDVASYWREGSLVAIDDQAAPQSVVAVSPTSGEVRETLFDARKLPGSITDVVPNTAGTAMLVVVDGSKLFWWAPGMSAPSPLDQKMLTAAWMPDAPTAPSAVTYPPEVFTARSGRPVRLDARDGRVLQEFDQIQDVTGLATTPDGRAALISHIGSNAGCADRAPVLERFDLTNGSSTRLVGDGLAPVVSPDGRLVAYGTECEGIGVGITDLRTGANYRMSALPPRHRDDLLDTVAPLAWSPDSKRILYRVRAADGPARYFTSRFRFGQREHAADYADLEVGRSVVGATYVGPDTIALASTDGGTSTVDRLPPATGRSSGGELQVRAVVPLFEVPGRIDTLVADPSGTSFLAISDNVLYRWSPGDGAPVRLADSVQYAAWLGSGTDVTRVERAVVTEGG
jgi:WD40 repeat protein